MTVPLEVSRRPGTADHGGVLARVGDAVDSAGVLLRMHDFSTQSMVVIAPTLDPDHLRSYRDHWGRSDLLWERVKRLPVGKVHSHEHLVSRDDLLRTEFYNEWLRPYDVGPAGLGVNLLVERGVPAAFGFKLRRGDALTDDHVALFTLLAPHLVRAAHIHRCLWQCDILEALAGAGFDTRHKGVLLVDAEARVAYANETAAAMFDSDNKLRLGAGALSTGDPNASAALRGLIAGCADRRLANGGPGGWVDIRRRAGLPLRILVAPFRISSWRDRTTWWGCSWPIAILIISDPGLDQQIYRAQLQDTFGLTPAETDVALEIGKGDGRNAAAARLAVAPGTVRIHLQRVFEKTGVHRQAELVRLLADVRAKRPMN